MIQFDSKEHLLMFLEQYDLDGLDSEWSVQSRELVEAFGAKEIDVNRWWVFTPKWWTCPCCKRSKPEIVRMNTHGHLKGEIHEHHDHVMDAVRKEFTLASENLPKIMADETALKFFKRIAFGFSAYDNTLVCSDCNEADAKAKKLLGFERGSYFSFSPREISEFIVVQPNQAHLIDVQKARQVWMEAKPIFEKRQKLIRYIAQLAATDTHWYQASKRTAKDFERTGEYLFKHYGLDQLSPSGPEGLLYKTNKHSGGVDSWRRKLNKPNPVPTDGQVRHMVALERSNYSKYPDDWSCVICGRKKFDCIRKTNSGTWSFRVVLHKVYDNGQMSVDFEYCKDCADVARSVGMEVKKQSGEMVKKGVSSLINADDLKSIIKPQPHCKHNIDNNVADKVVEQLLDKAYEGAFG